MFAFLKFLKKKPKEAIIPERAIGETEPLVSVHVMPQLTSTDVEGASGMSFVGSAVAGAKKDGAPKKPSKKILIIGGVLILVVFIGATTWYYIIVGRKESAKKATEEIEQILVEEQTEPAETEEPATSTPAFLGEVAVTTTPTPPPPPLTRPSDSITFLSAREYTLAGDLDSDQLSDKEEDLYGTDQGIPDTDSDTFPDGWEIFNLYDPVQGEKRRLKDSSAVKNFVNSQYKYELFVPNGMQVALLAAEDPREVVITAPTGEFITISVEPNQHNLNVRAFLESKYGKEANRILLNRFINKNEFEGFATQDGLTKYFIGAAQVYVWRYEFGFSPSVNYRQTFEAMSQAFQFEKPTEELKSEIPAAQPSTSTTSTI